MKPLAPEPPDSAGRQATATLPQRIQRNWRSRSPLAAALLPLAALFGLVTALRRAAYRLGLYRPQAVAVPVIVVGNLVAGGAGKTPTVMAIVQALRECGRVPGVVSRGHGRLGDECTEVHAAMSASQCGDEPLLIHRRTSAPVVVGRDRVAAARMLLQRHPEVDLLVSDDGLQHLRLARNAQVLVFDERGVGNGWLLPAGPLREPLPKGLPPRSLVLYNAPAPTTPLPGWMARRRLGGVVSLAGWWAGEAATHAALEALRGRPLIAAAGMAHPQRFFTMLREAGLAPTTLELPDHHGFETLPWPAHAADVVVTEKDATKLDPRRLGATRVWVATLDFGLDAAFMAALIALLPPPGSTHGNAPA